MMGYPDYVGPGSAMRPFEFSIRDSQPVRADVRDTVAGAAAACTGDRCQLSRAQLVYRQATEMYERAAEEVRRMEGVSLWCDAGHSFSQRDPGRKKITVTGVNPDTGAEENQVRQFCGGCEPTMELLARPVVRSPAPRASDFPDPGHFDPARVKALERELGEGTDHGGH